MLKRAVGVGELVDDVDCCLGEDVAGEADGEDSEEETNPKNSN